MLYTVANYLQLYTEDPCQILYPKAAARALKQLGIPFNTDHGPTYIPFTSNAVCNDQLLFIIDCMAMFSKRTWSIIKQDRTTIEEYLLNPRAPQDGYYIDKWRYRSAYEQSKLLADIQNAVVLTNGALYDGKYIPIDRKAPTYDAVFMKLVNHVNTPNHFKNNTVEHIAICMVDYYAEELRQLQLLQLRQKKPIYADTLQKFVDHYSSCHYVNTCTFADRYYRSLAQDRNDMTEDEINQLLQTLYDEYRSEYQSE